VTTNDGLALSILQIYKMLLCNDVWPEKKKKNTK